MIGEKLHSVYGFGRDSAQNGGLRKSGLDSREPCATLLLTGEAAIPVTLDKHLFRTPSLGGQSSHFRLVLPTIFLSVAGFRPARPSAEIVRRKTRLLPLRPVPSCLTASGKEEHEGRAACKIPVFGLLWQWLADWPPVATRSLNRQSSVPQWVRVLRRCSTAISLPAQPSVQRATCFIASKTQASADRHLICIAGQTARHRRNHTADPAGRGFSARGVLRVLLPKTKVVPCSKRS